MHRFMGSLTVMAALAVTVSAQAPRERGKDAPQAKDAGQSTIVIRMMAFDKEKTGKLTKEMITDTRLHRLFDQADANKDGIVTKEELTALAKKLEAEQPEGPGPGGRGPGGFDGNGGRGQPDQRGGRGDTGRGGGRGDGNRGQPDQRGGRGPGGGDGGPGRGPGGGAPMARGPGPGPGVVLGPFFQNMLNLTEEQKKQVADLQKEVDDKLAKILTDEQKKQLAEMRQRGPGGFGPDGGRAGPGRQPGGERNPAPKKDD